ncbi:Bifunctional inhibitor/plant lipid transfer protein/seed storage helical domain [Melia azedarach]|uniref:Bifunctional inhibitor/plant lipid transfer protein/seed storage helical domain n=1 Tax=Melia azedarach TaxID=155640 RepID=A0ACC1XHN2_MELAZ|nr:Bifunctional inhibitor/plant lipid transfer protein/seed storage helical domain [Melia azedarach]
MEGKKGWMVVLMLMVILMNGDILMSEAQSAAECRKERGILVNACKPVVIRRPPSAYCCERLRVTHVNCVCSVITPQLAALIDVNYAIKVIQSCGRQVPRHFKCGSITTP